MPRLLQRLAENHVVERAIGIVRQACFDVALENRDTARDRTLETFGTVHVVCNNAGVAGGSVIDTPIEAWRWVLGVNLIGDWLRDYMDPRLR